MNKYNQVEGFPGSSDGKESACNAEDPGSISGLGILSPREWNSNPFQYSCLENSMDRGAWRTTVHEAQSLGHNLAIEHARSSENQIVALME